MSSNIAASVRGAGSLQIPENYLYHTELELSTPQSPSPLQEHVLRSQKSRNTVDYYLILPRLILIQLVLCINMFT